MNNNNQPVIPPRRSMRHAAIIPASHWISIGYSQVHALAMERLQNDMKKYCDDEAEVIGLYGIIDSIALPYHGMMLPHWKKLAKSLSGRTAINSIQICSVSLPISVLDVMFSALHSVDIIRLVLDGTDLGNDGLERLTSFLSENTSLRHLGIGEDLLNDISIASSLSDSIQKHHSLEKVTFNRCGLNSLDVFEKVIEGCKRLESLSFVNEELGLEVIVISNFIRSNHPLKRLTLKRCKIIDSDVLQLAASLKKNTNLELFDLEDNDITAEGEKALLKAVFDSTSMDSIIQSNHTCLPITFDTNDHIVDQRSPLETEAFVINVKEGISTKQKIRMKVVLALCGVDGNLFDLSHFNDLPMQLMPRVLELIQEHTTIRRRKKIPIRLEEDALSRLFHTLRGWELPLLFENLSKTSADAAGKRKRRKARR